ncbi:MAG: VWA domain-containing protein, partial [Proteobacteria bacterium]|nr:VWA domain-containing protein [Pseudomonadota bacterium]
YSAQEILMQRDLAALTENELAQARHLVASLVDALASERGRRYAANARGSRLDFRRMLRRHALHSPECMQLLFRREKIKKPRLILLCDISGSMERYSRFLIEFIFALRRALPKVEVGVFATRLSIITRLIEDRNVGQALAQVTRQVKDWGGGTDIGGSLDEFNESFAGKIVRTKTVVVILSDGWDRGDPLRLRSALEQLRQRVHALLWLNPLLGSDGYQPLCTGIRTALPFIDQMLPAHNLASLAKVVRILREVWR